MLKKSKFIRYRNFISTVSNWTAYWRNKVANQDYNIYYTRRQHLKIEVPSALGGIFKEIFMDDFYELKRMKNKINSSSVVFDIGTNAGYFALFVSEKIGPAEIHCFEPFPPNYKLLSSNVRNNTSLQEKVTLNNKALAAPGVLSIDLFFDTSELFSPTASIVREFEKANNLVKVEAIDLEKYCSDHKVETIDLLKMDCEGAEYDIFLNLRTEFFLKIKNIYMETHDLDDQKNTSALSTLFRHEGFKVEIFPINDHTAMLWAEK